jgi:hypothetical protein
VRGANGRSRNAVPLRVIPERGQVGDDVLESSTKESCDVLHEDVSGFQYANGAGELGPEPAGIVGAEPLACIGDWLARESSGQNVNSLDGAPVDGGDVSVDGESGPVAT